MVYPIPKEVSNPTLPKERSSIQNGEKFTLELNSHSLSHFQLCEKRFEFSEIKAIVQAQEYYPFKRGSEISRVLSLWYRAKKRGYSLEKLEKLEWHLFKKMRRSKNFFNKAKSLNDGNFISGRMTEYFDKYRREPIQVIAVEDGFSKILYEDDANLFIYSGRPDLVVDFGTNHGIGWIDHKSESRESNIAPFNNQFVGYSWAIGGLNGLINYIGLQKESNSGSVLRREAVGFNQAEIDRWESDTMEWYFRIAHSVQKNKYLRSWRCESKYGVCPFYNLCTSGTEAEERLKIERDFVQLPGPYKSW